jgi:uncharacterized protein
VHQDGLVHVSQLADRYVSDPNQVVRVGQKVRVTVQAVDLARGRIALTMRTGTQAAPGGEAAADGAPAPRAQRPAGRPAERGGGGRGGKGPTPAPSPAFTPAPGRVAPNGMRFR